MRSTRLILLVSFALTGCGDGDTTAAVAPSGPAGQAGSAGSTSNAGRGGATAGGSAGSGAGTAGTASGGTQGSTAGAGGTSGPGGSSTGGSASAGASGGEPGGAAGTNGGTGGTSIGGSGGANAGAAGGSAGTGGASAGGTSAGGKGGSAGNGGQGTKDPHVVAELGPKDDPDVAPKGPSTCAAPKKGDGKKTKAIPSEFIARAYIEATGALPPQTSWNIRLATFAQNGCTAENLQAVIDLFKAPAFQALPYSIEERGSALFRAALGREIDAANLASLKKKLTDDPDGWCDYVSFIQGTDSFMANVDDYCSETKTNYHFETAAPIAIHGIVGDDALQNALNKAKKGEIVELAQGVLVNCEHTITVPPGVTLRTRGLSGTSGRQTPARMARLVRSSRFEGPLLKPQAGATVSHLFLDGRRTAFPPLPKLPDGKENPGNTMGQNVFTEPSGGARTTVSYLRSDNPSSGQNIRLGSWPGLICKGGALAEHNLVVNAANDNRFNNGNGPIWSDGIFTHCEHSIVRDNEVLDASDVALISFVSENGEQHSLIEDNQVLLAGNDAFGGLVVDPWTGFRCKYATCDFSSMKFSGNILWTGPKNRFVFGISTSSSPWSFISDPTIGKGHGVTQGGTFVGTTSGASRVTLQNAIYIANMKSVTVNGNWNPALIDFVDAAGAFPKNNCGKHATVVNSSKASGTWQTASELDLTDCL